MEQLLLHILGDYGLQSSWMANNKTKYWWPAVVHATLYSLPFLLIGSAFAVFVIWSTHLLLDHYRIAPWLCWLRNFLGPTREYKDVIEYSRGSDGRSCLTDEIVLVRGNPPWKECRGNSGAGPDTPPWLAGLLCIIFDNFLHLTINYAALRWL